MKPKLKKNIFFIIKVILAIFILIIQVYPVFYVVTSSFKTAAEQALTPYYLPSSLYLDNYKAVIEMGNIFIYFKNSIIITGCEVVILIVTASMAAFAMTKIPFKGRELLITYFTFGLMLPAQVALIPLFFIINKMQLMNTYIAVILPQAAFSLSYSCHLFRSFYKFLPNDLLEAAIIDGCSPLQCFVRIVVPISKNSILTIATMQTVFAWNDFINAYTFTNNTKMKTVTLGLNDFVGYMGAKNWGATFAMITLTVLPTFIFYLFTSKYMMGGLTTGAVKE